MERRPTVAQGIQLVKRVLVWDDQTSIRRSRGVGWYGFALLTLAIVYFGTGRLGLSLGPANRFAALIWLPSGLSVAALFLWGADLWPAITLGAFLVNYTTGAPLLVAAGIGIGNTLEALVCTALLKRMQVGPELDSLHDVLALVLVAAPVSALISATLGVGSLSLGGVISWSAAPVTWTTWWLGDVMSMVVVTPLLLTWSAPPQAPRSRKRLAEVGLIGVSVLVVGAFVFLGLLRPHAWGYPHVVFPLLIWAALRFGQRGASAVIATFAVLASFGTVLGVSPYTTGSLLLRLYYLQTYLGITAATTMILAAIVAERNALEQRKDEFISLASHELRTPLTSLLGYIQLLQRDVGGSDHPRVLRTLARMEMQGKKLSRLIADLLDLSKIQAGRLTFTEEAVNVDALVREVVEQIQQTST
jgi:integral membrane sensor domain MASE1